MKAPISLCLICRNDENTIEDCLKSIHQYVTEIIVVDTGSTDSSPAIAKKYATKLERFTDCNDPVTGLIEDFSQARQYSFSLATQPWIMWVDADDIITGGEYLNDLIAHYEKNKGNLQGTAFLLPYEYSYDDNGKVNCLHYRERLLTRDKFHWVNPVHEVLVPIDNNGISLTTVDNIVYKHQRQYHQKNVESGRNLRILKKYVLGKGKGDARQLYYLGLEYLNNGFIDEAIDNLTQYISVSGWEDERCMASLKLVDIFHAKGQYEESLKWAFKTVEMKENWGEGYFALAKTFYHLAIKGGPNEIRNWEKCIHFAKIGLALPITKTVLFVNPTERDIEIHRYLNMAFNKMGLIEEALQSTETALKAKPDDAPLLLNRKLYRVFLARHHAFENINLLKNIGEIDDKSYENIISLINNQPLALTNEVCLTCLDNKPLSNSLDIIFYAGQGVEDWTPPTVKRNGIGGSELMMIEMSKRLAALGHRVRVYNSCDNEGTYDGVEYKLHTKYRNLTCDVLVMSRRADMLADHYNVYSKLTLLWVHDVFAINATNELLLKADRILALSNWHKNFLIDHHNIHPDHIITTRNGIDLSRFTHDIIRDPFKCINSSSPDRSWPILLECWPYIKQRVPQASLHLYYGFKNWLSSAQHDSAQIDLINRLQHRIQELSTSDVVYHDRINQEQLAKEFLSAGCLIHPTWFTETSGITFMEAQAAGLQVVSSSLAALNETVADRGKLIPGDWCSMEYKNEFINSVILALTQPVNRHMLQKYAQDNFCLDKLAQEWHQMFFDLIENKKKFPLTPYFPTSPYRR